MKLGRNDPCPCGSGKKYKRCCMDRASQQKAELTDELSQIVAMNPNLTLDELNVVVQHKTEQANNQPQPDFCGLSPNQMTNWLYAPFNQLQWVTIRTPEDLSGSPVMRYLHLILEEAMQNGGSFKATVKGNLPSKLVKQANDILPEFAVSQFNAHISISEYAGSNEEKFNALHYTRVLAELSGIIYRRSGRYHVKKTAQKEYQTHGLKAFFIPMLEAATTQYNWGYLDGWQQDAELRLFWVFMLWRIHKHGSVEQLVEEVIDAFPDLILQLEPETYQTPMGLLHRLIELRFVERFLQYWGFVTVDPSRYYDQEHIPRKTHNQALFEQAFEFKISNTAF